MKLKEYDQGSTEPLQTIYWFRQGWEDNVSLQKHHEQIG
jgi:hypothetical protein